MIIPMSRLLGTMSLLMCVGTVWAAPNEPETYSRLNLSLGGYYYTGNLNQIQGNFQGHYGLSSPTLGVDLLFNGYRLWSKSTEDNSYSVAGDDAFATLLPFYYVADRVYVAGLARYESSRSQKLDSRYLGGGGIGFAPVRSKSVLVRVSVIPSIEVAKYDGEDFRIDVAHDGSQRRVFRVVLLSNGWYRVPDSMVTLRYFAQLFPNAMDSRDIRLNFTGNVDMRLTETVAFRIAQTINQDSAILKGKEPYDIRSTFGFAIKLQ